MGEHKWETDEDAAEFCGVCGWYSTSAQGNNPCRGHRRGLTDEQWAEVRTASWLVRHG